MTLRGEIFTHLGKDDIKMVLESPNVVNILKLSRALSFIVFILMYWLIYNFLSYTSCAFKMMMPSTRNIFDIYFSSGFWSLCIYFLELNGVKINIIGDHVEDENALIVSNHLSIVDHVVYPFLTRKTLKESEIDLFGVLSDSESDSDEEFKKKTKKVKKKKEKEQKKEVKQGYKIKFKILNNEESFFAKDLSSMLIPKNKFFTWFEIWSIPTIDYYQHISQADENWEMDGETLVSVFQNYFESLSSSTTTSQWLTLFPEVNILTEKDLRMQNISGEKHYLPILENVLYPRFGAFANAVGGLYKTDFTRLYDITLLYYNRNKVTGEILDFNPPTLLNILGLRNWNIETVLLVNVSGKFLSRVPLKRNKLEKYLENRWIKKDKLISKLKKRIMKENDAIMKLSEENND